MAHTYTVLIVDDEPVGRETLEALLFKEGYRLVFATNGVEALEQIASQLPDVVLLDVMMPEMDGFEVCRRLRANPAQAEIPVVLVTALDDQDSRLRGLEAGADDFITKPCNRLELRARIRNIVRLNRYRLLLDARGQFEQIFNLSPDGLVVVDSLGRVQMANPSMLMLSGLGNPEDLAGRTLLDWISPDNAGSCEKSLREVLDGTVKTQRLEAVWVRASGTHFPVEITFGAMDWKGESGAQTIVRDITDRADKILLEAKLMRAQRLESIGALASGIAHDLNNVLTPALMSVETLATRVSDPKGKTMLATLERSILRGAGIVKQVLAFGRGLEGEHNLLQVRYLLREIVQIATETFPKSIIVNDEIARDLWVVKGDTTQLHQAILNLCVNARDAMPGGGTLTIAARNVNLDETFSRMNLEAKPGPYILIEIADTGTGIPPAIKDKIFDPFFTTKAIGKGTGLGLSTVVGIVKKHQGFLQVRSEVGQGSQFQIYLPATAGEAESQAGQPPVPPPRGNGETILIADDEPAICEIMRETLEQNNYRVLTAKDGAEAVALYAQNRSEIKTIVLDFMMPVMDGAAAVQVIRYIHPRIPIVLMPGSPDEQDTLANALQAFPVKTVSKPFTANELLGVLALALKMVE